MTCRINGAQCGVVTMSPKESLDGRKGLFNGVEVGRVWREEYQSTLFVA